MDHDAPGEGAAVGELQSLQIETGPVPPPPVPRDLETAEGGAVAPGDIAEDGGHVGAAFPGAMHGVAGIDHLALVEGPDEQAGLPAGDAVIKEQAVILVEPFPLGIPEGLFRPDFQSLVLGIARDTAGAEQAACRCAGHDGSQDEEPK